MRRRLAGDRVLDLDSPMNDAVEVRVSAEVSAVAAVDLSAVLAYLRSNVPYGEYRNLTMAEILEKYADIVAANLMVSWFSGNLSGAFTPKMGEITATRMKEADQVGPV